MILTKKSLFVICILILSLGSSFDLLGNDDKVVGNNTQREEVQRYFGYEILPYRYLSLPYDLSVNANEKGVFVDIGFLYFAFIPLFLIAYLYRNKAAAILTFLSSIFIWIVGTSNSYLWSPSKKEIGGTTQNMIDYLLGPVSFKSEPLSHFVAYIYYCTSFIYKPLFALVTPVSGNADYITYPLLIILLLASSWLLSKVIKDLSITKRGGIIVFWIFLFFWIKFSAGIVWYGFLVLVMAFLLIMLFIQKGNPELPWLSKFLKYTFFTVAGFWTLGAMFSRMGEIHNGGASSQIGKTMLSPLFFNYQRGIIEDKKVLDAFYPYFNKALTEMNRESSSRILRIGTSFSYFIDNNSERILIDNQLGFFNQMKNTYAGDQKVITEVLKASGFKFIIVDLNTPYIDQTPEQSLKRKYDGLMTYLKGNTQLKLLATNRIYRERGSQYGKLQQFAKVFPTPNRDSQIVYGGQYAIYEII